MPTAYFAGRPSAALALLSAEAGRLTSALRIPALAALGFLADQSLHRPETGSDELAEAIWRLPGTEPGTKAASEEDYYGRYPRPDLGSG